VAVLTAIVAQVSATRALRCPRCRGSLLRPLLMIRGPVKRCPLCSADFHEAMPGQA
jgi:DNA-directed RNA polymerase subunit RPC12/RpoP